MTGTAAHSAVTRPALRLEWRLHHELLLIYAALAVGIVLVAVVADLRLGVVAILLAARLPADLADRVPEDGRQLRSSLGISRADAVRARTLVVCGGQLMLALAAAGAILLTDWLPGEGHWSSLRYSRAGEAPTTVASWAHLLDIGLWTGAILWTHALSGGRAFRLGARPSGMGAMAQFLGCCLLAWFLFISSAQVITMVLMTADTGVLVELRALGDHPFAVGARFGQVLTLIPVLGGGILALLLARRRWVRRA